MKKYIIFFVLSLFLGKEVMAKEGMPQLNPEFWLSQIFWLVIFFCFLYFLIHKFFSPKLFSLIDQRADFLKSLINETENNKNQIQKLDKKDRVMYIYAGKPSSRYEDKYGSQARIQLNDKFATVEDVGAFVLAERASKRQELQNVLTTALKVDGDTNMGLISDS